jgi:hypothetical protein
MINPFKEVNWTPTRAEKRKFAVSLLIGFPIIALLIFAVRGSLGYGWNADFPLRLGGFGFAAGLLFYILPQIASPFYVAWYALACVMGIIVGNILLGGFFFVLVTGIGLVLRAVGKCPISKRPNKSAATYWKDAEIVTDVERNFRQF